MFTIRSVGADTIPKQLQMNIWVWVDKLSKSQKVYRCWIFPDVYSAINLFSSCWPSSFGDFENFRVGFFVRLLPGVSSSSSGCSPLSDPGHLSINFLLEWQHWIYFFPLTHVQFCEVESSFRVAPTAIFLQTKSSANNAIVKMWFNLPN